MIVHPGPEVSIVMPFCNERGAVPYTVAPFVHASAGASHRPERAAAAEAAANCVDHHTVLVARDIGDPRRTESFVSTLKLRFGSGLAGWRKRQPAVMVRRENAGA